MSVSFLLSGLRMELGWVGGPGGVCPAGRDFPGVHVRPMY